MRRFVACVLAFLLALQAGAALAESYDHCCEGCDSLAMCVTVACKACPAQALLSAPPAFGQALTATPDFTYAAGLIGAPAPQIWRPPR